jgi:hypothetical protein
MKNIQQEIKNALDHYWDENRHAPYYADVTVTYNYSGKSERVKIKVTRKDENTDKDYFHVTETVNELMHLCENGNGQPFMVSKFHCFKGDPYVDTFKAWAFLVGKIRQLKVTELKVHTMTPIPDIENGNIVIVNRLSFKAAGLDKEYLYSHGKHNDLPINFRIFNSPDVLKKALVEDGEKATQLLPLENEYPATDCPIVMGENLDLFYRFVDIDQELYDNLPENMYYKQEDDTGIKTVCAWKWNGFKAVHKAVCEDPDDLTYDVLHGTFNFDEVGVEQDLWYANASSCEEDNDIEIVTF